MRVCQPGPVARKYSTTSGSNAQLERLLGVVRRRPPATKLRAGHCKVHYVSRIQK
jgi:hypothetical protein